ncbi:MAG: UDP-N-acetylmuramoyl-L-alanine--D-glutamate ligase [Clostridia bacterium]|nr:UDP-N-acetylmuramoyl-L-alanine--D-glutamate ligase [Clostridia bacterium]
MDFKDKKVLVIGMGKSGVAAAHALYELKAKVTLQDSKEEEKIDKDLLNWLKGKDIEKYFGRLPEDMTVFDYVVLSPGVSPEAPFLKDVQEKILGELELAYQVGDGTYIAITGTNGKTTTTTLVGEIFKKSGMRTHVVGNIGVAVVSESIGTTKDDIMVTETSSFQLETIHDFKPVVSSILNLTPDHLNRHHTFENYGKAKARIFENQDEAGYLVINYDDKECWKLREGAKAKVVPFSRKETFDFGAYIKDGKVYVSGEEIVDVKDIRIIGSHNLENVLAAAAIAYYGGVDKEVIGQAIREFPGVEHRIEYSGTVNGVKYYNDSKGTNVDAAVTAINAIDTDIHIIAGGDGKGQDFAPFVAKFSPKVKTMIALGRDGKIIADEARKIGFDNIIFVKDMEEAVKTCHKVAKPGDSVLLSPACASWDMYDNFEQRGNHFKKWVKELG